MDPEILHGKKITVVGLGLHGGAAAVVQWLVKHGAIVTVTDLKKRGELLATLERLGPEIESRVTWVLGQHRMVDFTSADLVVQSPGVPRTVRHLIATRRAGVPIVNEASLFFQFCPAEIIGITGTRGKSTTAALTHHLLSKSLLHRRVWLAGLPHHPMMSFVDRVHRNDVVVLELSSWQLEILGHYHRSPEVAVVTNMYPDHLNTYSNMRQYVASKSHIYRWQNKDGFAIFNFDNAVTRTMSRNAPGHVVFFSQRRQSISAGTFLKNGFIYYRQNGSTAKMVSVKDIPLVGTHNISNALAACAVAAHYKIPSVTLRKALKGFHALEGRIQPIRSVHGVTYVNDTTSTTPDATIAALNVFKKNVVLIAGGSSKKIPVEKYRELATAIKATCHAVVLFDGPGSVPIQKELAKKNFSTIVTHVASMTDAIVIAQSLARKNGTVLLSPASASFGIFINEFDRGDHFNSIVKKL